MATDVEKLIVRLEATQAKFEKQLASANNTANRRARAIEKRFASMNKNLEGSFRATGLRLAGIFTAIASVRGAQELIDTSVKIQNALKVAGLAGDDLTKVYDKLFASAQKNAAPLESLVELYSRVSLVSDDLGISQEQLINFVDKVGLSMRVSGQSASEQAGAILQLTQALGNGTVQAEEYNSLLDGAQPLLQAVAAGLEDAGGRVSTLTQLVKSGKVSSKAFFDAFEAGSYTLDQKVSGAEMTVSQAFVRLQNVLVDTAGKLNKGTGASRDLAKFLDELGRSIANLDFGPLIAGAITFAEKIGKAAKDTIAFVNAISDLGRYLGAKTGADQIGPYLKRTFGSGGAGKASQDTIQSRIDGAFANTSANDEGKPTDVGTVRPKKVSLADYPVKPKGGGNKRTPAEKFDRDIEQIKARTAAINAETAAQASINPLIADYGYAVQKAGAKQDLLNAAKHAGLEITPKLEASIETLAEGYAQASAEAGRLAESQDRIRQRAEEFNDLARDTLGNFIHDLEEGKSAADALGDALKNIGDRLLDMALNDLFKPQGGGSGGLLGSIFGGLFGGGFAASDFALLASPGLYHTGGVAGSPKSSRSVPAGMFAGAPRYHDGGIAGLKPGEVPAILQKGEVVLPRGASVGSSAGGITYAPVYNVAQGADPAAIAELRQAQAQDRAAFQSKVVKSIQDARKHNVKI